MKLKEVFRLIDKNLTKTNEELGFKKTAEEESAVVYTSDKGSYRLNYDSESSILAFECSYDEGGEYNTISRSLLDTESIDDREVKSLSNDVVEDVEKLFKTNKKVNIEKVKMPKGVSRGKAKSGILSYDVDSLANRFGVLYPEYKEAIKENIAEYGEFLPETFFKEVGNEKILGVIKNGSEAEWKKLFKALNEVFEDGTNEVQDIIGVTILGEMKGDPDMMAVADKYMSEYMAGPVHEINKLTKRNNRFTKKLENPPAYKPKKKKKGFSLMNSLNDAQRMQ
ncbi:MAG: hypothetical protein IJT65_06250 [Eubacterium sp.]|nr:hypothetical protein [Eubacterium sp.]